MDDLIFDRTQNDVNRAIELNEKYILGTMTSQEIAEWDNGLKGSYNYTDLNRVESWCQYLATKLTNYGYPVIITVKTNWTMPNFPTQANLERIRQNVRALKDTYFSITALPTSLDNMTFNKANAIEKILDEINETIEKMEADFLYSGTFYSGESEVLA